MPSSLSLWRRFPPPWVIEEHDKACFIVKDAAGRPLRISISRTSPTMRGLLVNPESVTIQLIF
jgi:hypothetical protein